MARFAVKKLGYQEMVEEPVRRISNHKGGAVQFLERKGLKDQARRRRIFFEWQSQDRQS